ncbi:MAG TPA: TetR/AcrR family transcriptional regulator [Longimicrobiaceae bacterium]
MSTTRRKAETAAQLDPREAAERLMRRVPQQDRGQRRVEKILDAAAEVIAEVGVEAATTNAIAARAETSVGSLYQFFPNKDAIVQALAARYLEQLRELKVATFDGVDPHLPLPELIEATVMPMYRFHQANPAYEHVYYATNRPDAPWQPQLEVKEAVIARIAELIKTRNPAVREEDARLYGRVTCETVHALIGESMRAGPADRPRLLAELKNVMARYLGALEPSAGDA